MLRENVQRTEYLLMFCKPPEFASLRKSCHRHLPRPTDSSDMSPAASRILSSYTIAILARTFGDSLGIVLPAARKSVPNLA